MRGEHLMGSGWSKKVTLAGGLLSFLGLLVQITGSLLTVATPRDTQGAVGKGMVAIPTCALVYLLATLGVCLCWSATK
jgi:hypothetical protein